MEEEDRLRKLKWPPLETHRLFFSLVECYKIVFGTNKLNFDDLFNLPSATQPALTSVQGICQSSKVKSTSYLNHTGLE